MDSLPIDEADLLRRARGFDGWSIARLAAHLGQDVAGDPLRTKGTIGELLEDALGASAGNLDLPDFPHLGIELKTIPVDAQGRVSESTFVCTVDLSTVQREEWETSRARRKLSRVLWVPVEAATVAALPDRHVGSPRIWSPTPEQEATLASDWHELIGLLALGRVDLIDAYRGEALQLRPKAANSRVQTTLRDMHYEALSTVPLGFYLRARFTENLLWAPAPATSDCGDE